jgi:hypothetical protein
MSEPWKGPWIRYRFHANADDYRPVKFPPPGPYWCSGYLGDGSKPKLTPSPEFYPSPSPWARSC